MWEQSWIPTLLISPRVLLMGDYNSEELQEASLSHLLGPKHSLITLECGALHVPLTESERMMGFTKIYILFYPSSQLKKLLGQLISLNLFSFTLSLFCLVRLVKGHMLFTGWTPALKGNAEFHLAFLKRTSPSSKKDKWVTHGREHFILTSLRVKCFS